MNFKNIKKQVIFIFIILLLILYITLKDNFIDILDQLRLVNLWWILLAIIVVIISWAIKAIALNLIIKEFKVTQKFKESFKITLITQFFNGITPFSTGGQPMQMYYLKKEKLSTAAATNVIIQNFIVYQIALILLGSIAIAYNYFWPLFFNDELIRKLIVLGHIINTSVIIISFLVSSNPKFNKLIGRLFISLSCKFKITKDREQSVNKWNTFVDNFTKGSKILRKQKAVFIKSVFYNLVSLILLYLTPLIIIYSFSDFTSFGAWTTLVTSSYVMLIGSFVPIPGGSVGLDFGFFSFFGQFIFNPLLSAVMLVWRFVTYYLGLFVGGIALLLYRKEND